MTEHIKDSLQPIIAGIGSVLCLLISIWWGIRFGDGIRYLTGINLRLVLMLVMVIGLLFQGYTSKKKSNHFNSLYRIMVWISGILISLLIYSLGLLFLLDLLTLLFRGILHIACPDGASAFHLVVFGMPAGQSISDYALAWGNGFFNYDTASVLALIGAAGITIYGMLHAQSQKIRKYAISLSEGSISPAKESRKLCRIVHLSDLHMGSVVTSGYIRRVLKKVGTLQPDYVFLTGDTFNHGFVEECAHVDRIAAAFRQLNEDLSGGDGSHRIFAVCGNHDPLPENSAFQQFLQDATIVLLNDEVISLPAFDLAGRSGNHKNDRKPLSDFLHVGNEAELKSDKPLIVLDHYPDGMQEAADYGAALFLCGHTHGGQYFPCNLLIRKQYSRKNGLLRGISQHGRTTGIVSLGTGFFQIPIRIGTDSEIITIDLYR